MKSLITLTLLLFTIGGQSVKTTDVAKTAPDPPTITVSKEASLSFQNHLLQINVLRAQADAATARADQLQSLIPDKVKAIADEAKIDTGRYRIARDRNGSYVTNDEGLLQFALIKKD